MAGLNFWGGGWTGWIVPFIFSLSIIVFFHELGHFLVARWCGVRVLVFSIGFGPELIGFNDRHGTRWKISAIPLGGYVKFFGDENAASVPDQDAVGRMTEAERRESFFYKSVGQRAAIVAAGPIANFILAIIIFAVVFTFYGKPASPARVDAVQPGSAAEAAGFQPADLIVAIDGRKIETFSDVQRIVSTRPVRRSRWTSSAAARGPSCARRRSARSARTISAMCTGWACSASRASANRRCRSIRSPPSSSESRRPGSWSTAPWRIFGGVIAGRELVDQLGGPIRIAQVAGQVATIGFMPILNFAGVLSVSIGLLNLFPIPLLDGGHLLFYAIEAIARPPAVGTGAGVRVPFRLGGRAAADAFRDLSTIFCSCCGPSEPWPSGNALTTKDDWAAARGLPGG